MLEHGIEIEMPSSLTFGLNTGKFRLGYSYDITVSKLGNGVSEDHTKSLWDSIFVVEENLEPLEQFLVRPFSNKLKK